MVWRKIALAGILLSFVLTGCRPSASAITAREAGSAVGPPTQARPLVILARVEPASVATRAFVSNGPARFASRLFNALPSLVDARGLPQPELLESLPSLNSDTWQVFPDGTMQTTYILRPNLKWHDGEAFTAGDIVFAWRVYATPELGSASQPPIPAIANVEAIDRQRFVIHWKVPYPDAATLSQVSFEFPALPQHILGPLFDQMGTAGRDTFARHSFWGPNYVGLGPYRLDRWEPGSFLDGVRFEGYALGVPKIGRIELRFTSDQNVVIASLLAGEAQVATESSIPQAPEALTQQWDRTGAGSVFQLPTLWRGMAFQLRPELANPRAILDLRARKAIAHAVDKQAISDAIYAGRAIFADSPVWKGSAWGDALDDALPTYALDPRATENFLKQVGLSKGLDGFYSDADGRFSVEVATSENPDNVREILVLADGLQRAGFDTQQRVIPVARSSDSQLRATFPTMQNSNTNMGEAALQTLGSAQIPEAGNRWLGSNRGGWFSPDYDRLLQAFNTSLDRADRIGLVQKMLRLYAEELPVISLFFPAQAFAYVTELKGPATVGPESNVDWNIHEWELKQSPAREAR